MKVTLSPKAREYVKREAHYLRSANPSAARQFSDHLKQLTVKLGRFPKMGKRNDELPYQGVFRFVMGAYLVDYTLSDDEVFILAIRHGRERPPQVALEDDFDLEEEGGTPTDG